MKKSLISLILISMLILTSCGGECKKDTDCNRAHFTAKCIDKKCTFVPLPNECGNFLCDGNENKCTCPQDCGPCTGSAGNYLDYKCEANKCITTLKPGTTTQPNKIFDDRSLGPVQLHNNYIYNTPFNVNKDEIILEFKIYKQDPTVSDFKIETIRILEGTQQLADSTINELLSEEVKTFKIKIPKTTNPEEEHQITIGVWYKYEQNGEKTGKYEKQLGKITLINT